MSTYNEAALETMVQAILEDGKRKADLSYKSKMNTLEKELESKTSEIESKKNHKKELIEKKYNEAIAQKEMEYDRMFHGEMMQVKKEYKDKLSLRIKEALDERLSSNLQSVVSELVKQLGDEAMEIQVGEYSKKVLSKEFFDSLPTNVTMSTNMIAQDGGFLINQGGVIYNALYSTYLEDSMEKFGAKFMSELSNYVE